MIAQIKGTELAKDVLEAEEQVEMHQERKVNIYYVVFDSNVRNMSVL